MDISEKIKKKFEKYYKILYILGIVISALVGVTHLYDWAGKLSNYRVIATGRYLPYSISEDLIESIKDYKENISLDRIEEEFPEFEQLGLDRFKLRSYLADSFPDSEIYELKSIEYHWLFDLKHRGNKQLDNLVLNIPFDGYYSVKKNDLLMFHGSFEKKIDIGSISPSDELVIDVWTHSFLGISNIKFKGNSNDIFINHTNGKIKIEYFTEVNGFLAWVKRNYLLINSLTMLFIAFFIVPKVLEIGLPKIIKNK